MFCALIQNACTTTAISTSQPKNYYKLNLFKTKKNKNCNISTQNV